MLCPIDNTELVMSDRQGVEIDYCPKCRGVWLDRGELDKIIDRSAAADTAPVAPQRNERSGHDKHDDDRSYSSDKPYRKKKSLLGELFDF
jgi:Zn-finger nucleic acid-binding protein